jgi:hypothetical protein
MACGLPVPDSHSEYTASGFSEPILTFFKPLYRTNKVLKREFWDRWSSVFKSGSFEIHTLKFFEEKLYQPVIKAVRFVSHYFNKAQNVDLDTFILYSFITIVILMVVIGWSYDDFHIVVCGHQYPFRIIDISFLYEFDQKVKAYMQGRRGPPLLQTYYNLAKLFKKENLYAFNASAISRISPYINLVFLLTASLLFRWYFYLNPPLDWATCLFLY